MISHMKQLELFAKWVSGSILLLFFCFALVFWKFMHFQLFVRCYFVLSTCADPHSLPAGWRREGKKDGRVARRGKREHVCSMVHHFPISRLRGFLVDPCCHHRVRVPCNCHFFRSRSAKHKRRGDLSSDTKGCAESARINPWVIYDPLYWAWTIVSTCFNMFQHVSTCFNYNG